MFVVNYYAYRYGPFGRKKSGDADHGPTRAVPCSVSPSLDYWKSIEVMAVMRHPIRGSGFLLQSARCRKFKAAQQANPSIQLSYLPWYHLSIAGRNRYRVTAVWRTNADFVS